MSRNPGASRRLGFVVRGILGELMDRNTFSARASLVVALICAFAAPLRIWAHDPKTPYPRMAPLDQYLMERNAEIAMARSAAPEAISRDADVLVLGRHGYETAVKGKNGFVCVVERGWMGPFHGESAANFWNPKLRGPLCFNPPAARSILPITYKRTEMVLAGQSKAQIFEGIKAFIKQKLPPLEPGAISYMMSKEQYLNDGAHPNWIAHVMIYTPLMDGSAWGADLAHSPVMLNPQFHGDPEPIDVFMIPVGRWSDGTQAPMPK
ncbi:MAG TPA: hypothetical protein VGR97_03470 [Candidatus Acidoferrales bacterium]|nr:hypothetical protein [Candidatus Acidoferrales bacterium]